MTPSETSMKIDNMHINLILLELFLTQKFKKSLPSPSNSFVSKLLVEMIPHLKAFISRSLNQERHWVWYHPGDGHACLTEKASLLLKLIWPLP